MFNSEVQFGHAGACANSDRETAVTKNKVLKESGAFVPKSFDDLGELVGTVFKGTRLHLVNMMKYSLCTLLVVVNDENMWNESMKS